MSTLIVEKAGPVITALVNNPPYNFLTADLVAELQDMIEAAGRSAAIRAVVLGSAVPGIFVSHYDVGEIADHAERVNLTVGPVLTGVGMRSVALLRKIRALRPLLDRTPAAALSVLLRLQELTEQMRRSDMVFVAAIGGRAMGGGCELALGCDIRVMANGDYGIGQPEILLGLMPGGGGTQILTRTIGAARTLELALEGITIAPQRAYDIGIAQRLVEPSRLLIAATEVADRLARRSPASVAAIKRAIYGYGTQRLSKGMRFERAHAAALGSTPAARTAMAAYHAEAQRYASTGRGAEQFFSEQLPRWINGEVFDFTKYRGKR